MHAGTGGIMNSTVTTTGPLVEELAAARAQSFSREEWIFLAIAAIITTLRTYSRWSMVGWRRFQADDVLVWLALVSDTRGKKSIIPRTNTGG